MPLATALRNPVSTHVTAGSGPRSGLLPRAQAGGAERLRLVHANDSEDGRESSRDRHARIGEGRTGVAAAGTS